MRIAGTCSMIAPVLMLGADLLQIGGLRFEFSLALWLAFVFFVPAIIGLTYLIASYGSRLALLGGASAFFGAMAGASMQVLFRVYAVLDEKNAPEAVELLQKTLKLIATTQMIGIFFPLGLLILAFCLYRKQIVNPPVILVFVFAAILFPVGRIGGFWWAFIGSDILFIAAFGILGWRMFSGYIKEAEGTAKPDFPDAGGQVNYSLLADAKK
jgi:hypothetical protein